MRAAAVLVLVLIAAPALAQDEVPLQQRIAELSAADATTRAFAACYIAEARDSRAPAVQPLARLLADATTMNPVWCDRDRGRATTVLATWTTTPGIEAARALARSGLPGIEALLAAARSRDAATRGQAIHGLSLVARFIGRVRGE
jgi:hypothetical protein